MASLTVFAQDDVLKTIISFFPLKSPFTVLNRRTIIAARDVARQSRPDFPARSWESEFSSQTCECSGDE